MNLSGPKTMANFGVLLLLVVVLATGITLRVSSFEAFQETGFDEKHYSHYVDQIHQVGPLRYPEIIALYIEKQTAAQIAFLPPTRVAFLLAAAGWKTIFGSSAVESVRAISTTACILLLLGTTVFAWRLGGPQVSLGLTALMAFAPTQLYMAHRALIDGFFATVSFFVIWALWESLQNARSKGWLILYGIMLAVMVMTKENAAFVYLAILGILIANHWLKIGQISKHLIIATMVGPLIGAIGLVIFAGGTEPLFSAYLLNVRKSYDLPYAIATGDGPWFRYLSDLILVSPAVIMLAIGGAFQTRKANKAAIYFIGFILLSYCIMGNLRYGMNLRYALIWDFPLRYLALLPLFAFGKTFTKPQVQTAVLILGVGLMVYFEITNYCRIFVENAVYDPVPNQLMHALQMIK